MVVELREWTGEKREHCRRAFHRGSRPNPPRRSSSSTRTGTGSARLNAALPLHHRMVQPPLAADITYVNIDSRPRVRRRCPRGRSERVIGRWVAVIGVPGRCPETRRHRQPGRSIISAAVFINFDRCPERLGQIARPVDGKAFVHENAAARGIEQPLHGTTL